MIDQEMLRQLLMQRAQGIMPQPPQPPPPPQGFGPMDPMQQNQGMPGTTPEKESLKRIVKKRLENYKSKSSDDESNEPEAAADND